MSDILIRDIPDEVLTTIDAQAARLGLSRSEYVRRELSMVAQRTASTVTTNDFKRFSERFADLADPDVTAEAWS